MSRNPIATIRARLAAHPEAVPLLAVTAAVLIANLPALAHLVTSNPLAVDANVTSPTAGALPGLPTIDPNAGYTTQALGHLTAMDWFHGHVPWWNPFEGAGAPLVGEMQSGAFFPLTLLLALHQGLLFLQLSLEAITAWSTYLLARKLGIGRSISTAAGICFGLCGTYAWFAHAPIRPVAFLPVCLLGVERAIEAGNDHRRGGWHLLAVGIALSILAGFPETAFIDGLFVLWWAVLRMKEQDAHIWRRTTPKVVAAAVIGVSIAAPLLVAFTDYLPYAFVGPHSGVIAHASIPSVGLVQVIQPYSFGPIFAFHGTDTANNTLAILWGNVGGFLSATLVAAGLVGLWGKRHRLLRVGLGVWVLVSLLRTFGYPPVVRVMADIPGLRLTAFFRYSPPSWELAVIVLAALGLDDISRRTTRARTLTLAAIVTGLVSIWATATAWPYLTHVADAASTSVRHAHVYTVVSLAAALVLLALLVAAGVLAGRRTGPDPTARRILRNDRTRRRGRVAMAVVVSAESIALLGFTYASAPKPSTLQTGSVAWLQSNLGTYRFYSLAPIQPNYGSYFGIAQANVNDLPVSKGWDAYVASSLDPNAPTGIFTGVTSADPAGPSPAEELTKHLAGYAAAGVRYVIENGDGLDVAGKPFPAPDSPAWPEGPRLVYRDSFAEIWQLPSAAPPFTAHSTKVVSATSSSCKVVNEGWDVAQVDCPHPSVLVRRVEYLPGWEAHWGAGNTEAVKQDTSSPDEIFQQIVLPAGKTTVRFTYLPPHEIPAIALSLAALLALLGSLLFDRRSRRRQPQTEPASGVSPRD